jgi:hypothetical protein
MASTPSSTDPRLLPLVVVNDQVLGSVVSIFHPTNVLHPQHVRVSTDFTEYRAEDFGRAVAFCALALGIRAIRRRKWGQALAAGVVLAAASGTHLIPAAVVGIALLAVGLAELLRGADRSARLLVLRQCAVLGAAFAVLAVVIRLFAGGTFGLGGVIGLMIVALAVLEALLLYLGPLRPWVPLALTVALTVILSAAILPASASSQQIGTVSREREVLVDWLRRHTPCNARFLVNQRTEGAFTVLTGRYALLEGMGPFLRIDTLPYVTNLFVSARRRCCRAHTCTA